MRDDAAAGGRARGADAVLRQVLDLVEPLTRFDAGSVAVLGTSAEAVPVSALQRFDVHFDTAAYTGDGGLPGNVVPVAGGALADRMAQAAAAARAALPRRLGAWLARQHSLPGDALTAADCYDGPYRAGFSFSCSTCAGSGEVACRPCNGGGTVSCWNCQGTMRERCTWCGGSGDFACGGCGGSGLRTEQQAHSVWDSSTSSYRTEWRMENVPCASCGGRRRQSCGRCGGDGKVHCTACAGGYVTCNTCRGRGRVGCEACGATGARHQVATLSCTVQGSFTVSAATGRGEPRAVIDALPSLAALCAVGRVQVRDARAGEAGVARELTAEVDVATVGLRAGEREFELLGYGPRAEVRDFKNIVGTLLQADLDALEAALRAAPTLPLRPVPALDGALHTLLASEINAAIGEHAGDADAQIEALAAERFRHAVSGDYAVRAARALRHALARAFRSEMPAAVLMVASVPTLAIALWLLLPAPSRPWGGAAAVAVGVLAGWLAGVVAERLALRRFRARFDAALALRAEALLKRGPSRWWWRAAMVAAAAAVFAVGAALADLAAPGWLTRH